MGYFDKIKDLFKGSTEEPQKKFTSKELDGVVDKMLSKEKYGLVNYSVEMKKMNVDPNNKADFKKYVYYVRIKQAEEFKENPTFQTKARHKLEQAFLHLESAKLQNLDKDSLNKIRRNVVKTIKNERSDLFNTSVIEYGKRVNSNFYAEALNKVENFHRNSINFISKIKSDIAKITTDIKMMDRERDSFLYKEKSLEKTISQLSMKMAEREVECVNKFKASISGVGQVNIKDYYNKLEVEHPQLKKEFGIYTLASTMKTSEELRNYLVRNDKVDEVNKLNNICESVMNAVHKEREKNIKMSKGGMFEDIKEKNILMTGTEKSLFEISKNNKVTDVDYKKGFVSLAKNFAKSTVSYFKSNAEKVANYNLSLKEIKTAKQGLDEQLEMANGLKNELKEEYVKISGKKYSDIVSNRVGIRR